MYEVGSSFFGLFDSISILGAERKARDEERRANKRKMNNTGKRRIDELYHTATERSEFYSMADLSKAPFLFRPGIDPDKPIPDFGTELTW